MSRRSLRRFFPMVQIAFALSILLSGCGSELRTETVVMPSNTTDRTHPGNGFESFEISNIYRLPKSFIQSGQLLGWADSDTILASIQEAGATQKASIQSLSPPYEEDSQFVHKRVLEAKDGRLSPNGEFIAQIPSSSSPINDTLILISLADGTKKKIPVEPLEGSMFIQSFSWSDNGAYLIYLVLDAADPNQVTIGVYDVASGNRNSYQVKEAAQTFGGRTLLDVKISDDAQHFLFTSLQSGFSAEKEVMLGGISGKQVEMQYIHSMESDQVEWLDINRFLFIGMEGTLYQYDIRNGDLSVMSEKVGNFALSFDKSRIAYYAYEEEAVYAGQVQGKNVLYQEPVYHGLLPEKLIWSSDRLSLLIYGSRLYTSTAYVSDDSENRQAFILRFGS